MPSGQSADGLACILPMLSMPSRIRKPSCFTSCTSRAGGRSIDRNRLSRQMNQLTDFVADPGAKARYESSSHKPLGTSASRRKATYCR
jgi:hypothetical protein